MKTFVCTRSRYCWSALIVFVVVVTVAAIVVFVEDNKTADSADDDDDVNAPTNNGSQVTDSLRFVVAISRHGNRGGVEDYPLDPYPINDSLYWPYGTNELTPYGRVQMYRLGIKLRFMYNLFLNVPYNTKQFYAGSTGVERVIMSGELVLASLFKPFGLQIWMDSLLWQPVPIYSNTTDHSSVVSKCPRYVEEKTKVYSQFLADDAANISALTGYVTNVTGVSATDSTLYFMFDKLVSEDLEGYEIPGWAQEIYPQPLADFYGKDYIAYFAGSDEIVRLVIGSFFAEVLSVIQAKVDGDSLADRRMHYYSAHDSSIVALQALLGIPKSSIIGVVHPGSAMIIELHQDSDGSPYYVEVLFIDGASADLDPSPVNLATCGSPCYYETLVNITKKFTDVDYTVECFSSSSNTSTSPASLST